jgi:hypothetical protein
MVRAKEFKSERNRWKLATTIDSGLIIRHGNQWIASGVLNGQENFYNDIKRMFMG